MSNVTALKREQVLSEKFLARLEGLIAEAREGKITEMCVVATVVDDGIMVSKCGYGDPWRLVGALELAKSGILETESLPADGP